MVFFNHESHEFSRIGIRFAYSLTSSWVYKIIGQLTAGKGLRQQGHIRLIRPISYVDSKISRSTRQP